MCLSAHTGYTSNFDIVNAEETSTQALSYDYDSIMHYDAFAFSANDHPTITPVDESVVQDRLGQRERLSETDKEHIKKLYCMSKWPALMCMHTYPFPIDGPPRSGSCT